MSEDKSVIDETTSARFQEWNKDHGVEVEEMNKLFLEKYTELLNAYENRPVEFYQQRARFAVKSLLIDPLTRSQAKPAAMFILGFGRAQDIHFFTKRRALELYQDKPKEAIEGKYVSVTVDKETGEKTVLPLGRKEKYRDGRNSPYYQKPLPYQPQRHVIGVGMPLFKNHQQEVINAKQNLQKIFHLKVGKYIVRNGKVVVNNAEIWDRTKDEEGNEIIIVHPQLDTAYELMVNLRRPKNKCLLDPAVYRYNDAARLRPKIVSGTVISENVSWEDPNIPFKLLSSLSEEFYIDIPSLSEWCDLNKNNFDAFVVVEGWVSDINHNPEEGQSVRMEIQDMIENPVNVWVHNEIYEPIKKMGRRTHVAVLGSAYKDKDNEGNDTLHINAWRVAIDYEEFFDISTDPLEQYSEGEEEEEE